MPEKQERDRRGFIVERTNELGTKLLDPDQFEFPQTVWLMLPGDEHPPTPEVVLSEPSPDMTAPDPPDIQRYNAKPYVPLSALEDPEVVGAATRAIWLDRYPEVRFEDAGEIPLMTMEGHARAVLEGVRQPFAGDQP